MLFEKSFFPTPEALVEQMLAKISWKEVHTVLEPSAGKGNIVDVIRRKERENGVDIDIDCIEINPELRATLNGKGYRVVHDDFLTYPEDYKRYDLIVMNPPFNHGADVDHLLKALHIQRDGGAVVSLLNAAVLKWPNTNKKLELKDRLEELGASIEYIKDGFVDAENECPIEVALVKVMIPQKEYRSEFMERLQKKHYAECKQDCSAVASADFFENLVESYQMELESGIALIKEYLGLLPYMESMAGQNCDRILELKVKDKPLTINNFVRKVRFKYWSALFANNKFTDRMTEGMKNELYGKMSELLEYDFSTFNIRNIMIEMSQMFNAGVKESVLKLFDELTIQYTYAPELSKNRHYYNGWTTNKAYYINKKVVIPHCDAWPYSYYFPNTYYISRRFEDMVKCLDFLTGNVHDPYEVDSILRDAREKEKTKNIRFRYFDLTFYKKGTAHLTFTDEYALCALNIMGSQGRGWLPPSFGKKAYSEMSKEEQAVINSFDGGKEVYAEVFLNKDKYHIEDCSFMVESKKEV